MPKKERIKGKRFYFLGIGGASMSALAKYILCEGGEVFGYDAQFSARTEELARAGVEIYTSGRDFRNGKSGDQFRRKYRLHFRNCKGKQQV